MRALKVGLFVGRLDIARSVHTQLAVTFKVQWGTGLAREDGTGRVHGVFARYSNNIFWSSDEVNVALNAKVRMKETRR